MDFELKDSAFIKHLRFMSPIELWSSMEGKTLLNEFKYLSGEEQLLFIESLQSELIDLTQFYNRIKEATNTNSEIIKKNYSVV